MAKRAVGGGVKVSYISQQNNSHVLEVPEVGGQRRWRLPASYLYAVAAMPHRVCSWQAMDDRGVAHAAVLPGCKTPS